MSGKASDISSSITKEAESKLLVSADSDLRKVVAGASAWLSSKTFKRLSTRSVEEAARFIFSDGKIMLQVVRCKQGHPKLFKVVSFGTPVILEGTVPPAYRFQFNDVDNALNMGIITTGFRAIIEMDGHSISFSTREGIAGPEYALVVDSQTTGSEWSVDVDNAWVEALQVMENEPLFALSEDQLDSLDADPLFLFGLADVSTQRAIEQFSSKTVPALRSIGDTPAIAEWFSYLNADAVVDSRLQWIVQTFASTDLPEPWISYKGVGSLVCFLNQETNETTWKHPFYDYFVQLLQYCRICSEEEHVKLRINRLLWTYEAESASDILSQQPLISPKYISLLADILKVDVLEEWFLVRLLKTFLKAFALQYRLDEDLDIQEIKWCFDILRNERDKRNAPSEKVDYDSCRQIHCIECGIYANLVCSECSDGFCEGCFGKLHSKGNRRSHTANYFIMCSLCAFLPAVLQCTFSFGCFCTECYAKHAKSLPAYLDLRPLRIDYGSSNRSTNEKNSLNEWHGFFDLRGAKYYYNFRTQESSRRLLKSSVSVKQRLPAKKLQELTQLSSIRSLTSTITHV